MANLKEIRGRITSISSTMQITRAMKMVSAAKLKKAQDAIVMLRPYSEKLQELIQNVNSSSDPDQISVYAQKREVKRVLFIAVTSNRGLAGAFNSSIVKELNLQFQNNAQYEVEVLPVGKKVYDAVRRNRTVYTNGSSVYDNLNFDAVAHITEGVMTSFREGKFDEVYVIYNKFVNAATQEVTTEQLLPISMPENTEPQVETDYIFEPNRAEILDNLIPKSIKTQVFKAILDSVASEHGARMTAMHKATDNAQALKNDLVIFYNKARQAAITNEILEIVSGAEALKNS
ncbi:F-type H+-transporting ATPase subunit gamma [Chryseobacterium bernardetii]|jgi:F-type H+-transporting ATPase subunit gamma|uniref:ATP synthase gamma chain n=3 Tax=Chryseobacterium TaxID=59732 RepID=A0A543EJY4_9FLAO|nr:MULTISPECIES: ATP synthase F1 subunit gamma [Chryseobacterium]MDR6370286.1 F-type H+-transporting ATPase subunit gamma [Chryseobacterium vietnamense]MDR6440471.1 F-type H+-transporting ATPase subunit gamma [Chryseobacterium bernardetii]MDR6458351.1 F-type H+-transporting ATPase subunit gamma [Chryseobacterium vietnamense]MDR6486963.1 F-type H+-transporting ATPase subunit gamma [Chryseobacterium vietnamense]TQM21900.1 F-type H+-transporting ATPase subunit gamma [Chryseobacterium aquifrigiden